MTDLRQPGDRLEQLTALRFFAALAVLASHLWILADEPNPLQPVARTLFAEGFAGVSFFFMLSGYILSHSYGARLRDGHIGRREYLALRLARIVPLHWLCAVPLAVAALTTAGASSLPVSLTNLALLQSWVPDEHWYFSLNEPSWSLSDEMFFYACFAVLAFWSPRQIARLAGVLLTGATAVVLWRTRSGAGAIRAGEAMTATHWLTYILPLTRLLDFTIGILLHRLPRPGWTGRVATALELAALAALVGALLLFPALGVADAWRMQLAYLGPIAALIWIFGHGQGRLSRQLARNGTLVLLGEASFALYLVHLPVIHAGIALDEARDVRWQVMPLAGAMAGSAILLSLVVFLWVERPLLAISRGSIRRRFARNGGR